MRRGGRARRAAWPRKLGAPPTEVKAAQRLDSLAGDVYVSTFATNRFTPTFREQRAFVPNIASAKKNMRKSRAATVRNRAQRSTLRTALKRAAAAEAPDAERTRAIQLLDRSARKGLIHKNAAARKKRQLMKKAS